MFVFVGICDYLKAQSLRMWSEVQNASINREQFSFSMFQFMAHENSIMQALYSLAQRENEIVCMHKRVATIITSKEIQKLSMKFTNG